MNYMMRYHKCGTANKHVHVRHATYSAWRDDASANCGGSEMRETSLVAVWDGSSAGVVLALLPDEPEGASAQPVVAWGAEVSPEVVSRFRFEPC